MPIFEGDMTISTCHRVRVEAEDMYKADELIMAMSPAEIATYPEQWTAVDDGDQLPSEVRR